MFVQLTPHPPLPLFLKEWLYRMTLLNLSINELRGLNDMIYFLYLQIVDEGSFDIKGCYPNIACLTGMMNLESEWEPLAPTSWTNTELPLSKALNP